MRLTIRSFSSVDVGTYHCVSTNSLGRAEGTLRLYGMYQHCIECIAQFSLRILTLIFDFAEIKIHPGTSDSDGDQLNIIGGKRMAAKLSLYC